MVLPSQTAIKRVGALAFVLGLAAVVLLAAACSRLEKDRSAKSTPTLTPVATASPAPTGTPIPTVAPGGFLYAKEVAREGPSGRYTSIYELFLTDSQGANPESLFQIGGVSPGTAGWGLFRGWHLLPKEKAILVNLGRELVRYDLETGQPTPVYTAGEGKGAIIGYALSHDQRHIALNLYPSEEALRAGLYRDGLLVILDYDAGTGNATIAAEVPAPETREGRPVAGVWSPDDRLIFFQGVAGGDAWPMHLWNSFRDGSGLHPLPALTGGILSPDGRWYAYTDGELPPWLGLYRPCSVIGLLDLATGTTSNIVQQQDPYQWFILRAWSPDSGQLLYSSRPSSAPTLPIDKEYEGDVSYLYDLSTGSSRPVPSWQEQKRSWLDLVPACARQVDIFDFESIDSAEAFPSCGGDLIIGGRVVDSGRLIYIGRLPALE